MKGVGKYEPHTITLTATGSYGNPYLEMPGDNSSDGFVYAIATCDCGSPTIRIDGFWDGGDTWKVRIAPTLEGVWSYTTYSTDNGLNGQTGRFWCGSSTSHGFPQVDPDHPHHFILTDGTPYIFCPVTTMIDHFSDNAWPPYTYGAQGGDKRIDDGTFNAHLTTRASQNFNGTWWGFTGFNKPMYNANDQTNEGGAVFTAYDEDVLNPVYHQYGDLRMAAMMAHGLFPMIQLGWPDQSIFDFGDTRLKRYLRYMIARYAAYHPMYTIFGEADEIGATYLATVDDYSALIQDNDPYDHLITWHLTGGPSGTTANRARYMYVVLQDTVANTSNYLQYNKPVLNAEYGGYDEADQDTADGIRVKIWGVWCRGGYYVYECWGDTMTGSAAPYAAYSNTFFQERTTFNLLEYHPELFSSTPGIADPGSEYVNYFAASASPRNVDLSDVTGNIAVEWWNPRDGTVTGASDETGGGTVQFTPPDSNDWVLHIGGP